LGNITLLIAIQFKQGNGLVIPQDSCALQWSSVVGSRQLLWAITAAWTSQARQALLLTK
jgi:hypothetical protein